MIWHIFKKDWKLLWQFAACFGALHFVLNAVRLSHGRFYQARFALLPSGESFLPGRAFFVESILPMLALLGSAFLIIAIVHQDAIPGHRQDWLVRPIRKRDLLLAKLVAVLVMVQLPIFAADLAEALVGGFPLGQSMGTAFGRSAFILLGFTLPLFAFASLTRNFMEAIALGVAVALGVTILAQLTQSYPDFWVSRLAVRWIDYTLRAGILVAGAAVLLGVQYFHRKTILSRWLLAAVGLLYWLVPPVPWQAAFALNQRLAPTSGIGGNPVTIGFVPSRESLADRPVGPSNARNLGSVFVLLPMRATGQPEQSVLLGDRSQARVVAANGEVHELDAQMGFQIWKEHPGEGDKPITYGIRVPAALYQRIAEQPVRVEIDYFLTLMRQQEAQVLPASGGDQRTTQLGWCGTRLEDDGLQVLYGCLQAVPSTCTSVVMEYPPTGARNPRVGMCRPDYSPYRIRSERDDALTRFSVALPFTDPSIADPLAVRAPMLGGATVTARVYEPQDHFVRHLVIPEIRLKEWATE